MTAPAGAAASALVRDAKCVASSAGPEKSSSTKIVASEGGKGALQSPMSWHAESPTISMVAPLQACVGITSRQPQPDGSASKPAGQGIVHPTGTHDRLPRLGRVPAGQSSLGVTSTHPTWFGSGSKPSGHAQLLQG